MFSEWQACPQSYSGSKQNLLCVPDVLKKHRPISTALGQMAATVPHPAGTATLTFSLWGLENVSGIFAEMGICSREETEGKGEKEGNPVSMCAKCSGRLI